jgi:hypothetical protein
MTCINKHYYNKCKLSDTLPVSCNQARLQILGLAHGVQLQAWHNLTRAIRESPLRIVGRYLGWANRLYELSGSACVWHITYRADETFFFWGFPVGAAREPP